MNVTWYMPDGNRSINVYEKEDVSLVAAVTALVVVLWILLANSLIIVCFIINRKTIWPSFSKHVLCLSLTDLVVGLTSFPLTILPFLDNTVSHGYCSMIFLIFYGSQCASLYQIFGICVHRCIIINKASRLSEQRSDFGFPLVLALSSWILSMVVNALLHFFYGLQEVEIQQCQFIEIFKGKADKAARFLFIVYFVPFILTNILYIMACFRLRCIWKTVFPAREDEFNQNGNLQIVISTIAQGNEVTSIQDNGQNFRTQKKVLRTIGSILLIFDVCTFPLIAIFLIAIRYQVTRTFKFIATTTFIMNSALNPFVYALRTNWLKIALKQLFKDSFRFICRCHR